MDESTQFPALSGAGKSPMVDLRTNDDFDRFLEAAGALRDESGSPQHKVDPNLLDEVMNFRHTF